MAYKISTEMAILLSKYVCELSSVLLTGTVPMLVVFYVRHCPLSLAIVILNTCLSTCFDFFQWGGVPVG